MTFPLNPDLSTTYQVPGVFGYISTQGAGPSGPNRRVLLLGYMTSAGIAAKAGAPIRINSETDVATYCGKGSDMLRMYRAFNSHGGIGAEVWICALTAPSGTAQTRLLKIMAAPTAGILDVASTAAAAAGILSITIAGYRADTVVANGDTYATIATNALAELLKIEDFLPCTVTRSSDTLTFTARHAALTSADFPIIVSFSSASMSIAASPGTLTYTSSAGADGTSILYCATQSVATTIANGDAVGAITTAQVTAINQATSFPLAAARPTVATGVLTLFYVDDRVYNWFSTAITPAGTITTTLAAAVGNHAAGLPSSSTPSLSTVLDKIKAVTDQQGAFRCWVTNFTGAGSFITDAAFTQIGSTTSYANMGTLSSFIEAQGNGLNCKGQVLVFGDTRSLATAGAMQTSTTPALIASPRYFPDFIPACPQQGYEMAARDAALIISEDFYPRNYAGSVLKTDGKVPLLGVHPAVAMSDSDANSAMLSYYMAPIRMNSLGQYVIVSGRTSAKPSATIDVRYAWRGQILTCDYFRDDYRSYMGGIIKGKSIKQYSAPSTTNTITPDAIRDLTVARMKSWDDQDFYDGAEALRDHCQAAVNVVNPARMDIAIPTRVPAPFEQLSAVFFTMV